MPKGYVIFIENITDEAAYQGYVAKAAGSVMQSGGSAIVLHDDAEVLEGEWPWKRTVILEFESVDKAREWYNSPEYQAIVGERHAAADANAVIVGGFEMPG
jgi:uncharacterized protein (DUF1330 family)